MNDDKEFGILSCGQFPESDNYKWEVIPMYTTVDNSDNSGETLQTQIYDLMSKNYSLEYKNKELTEKVDSLESEIIGLLCKVADLEEIIIKVCEEYILIDDD